METKNVIFELRTKSGLSQDELAEKVFVTRQAVSRWENGETTPNTETLKLLSRLFDVSINTLISRDAEGFFNEDYCKWCCADGRFMYHDMDELIEVCVRNMAGAECSDEQVREYLREMLPKLDYWKTGKNLAGAERFAEYKQRLIDELNALGIDGMPRVEELNALVGSYVNLEYRLPSGMGVRFLDDGATYLGSELQGERGRCFGVVGNAEFLLVCSYGENAADPELLVYKTRNCR